MKHLDPIEQLRLLKVNCDAIAPLLYRDHALYLENARTYLLKAVRQVIFILITQNNHIDAFTPQSREAFQLKIDQLVSHCQSLLTVEQLMEYAIQVEEENKIKKQQLRNELINAINKENIQSNPSEGSISLSLSPPIENLDYLEGWLIPEDEKKRDFYESENETHDLILDDSVLEEQVNDDQSTIGSNSNEDKKKDLDVLRSLFLMAGELIAPEKRKSIKNNERSSSQTISNDSKEAQKGLLPDNPLALYGWMNSIEIALSRRLLNLSYSLNVELLRVGIINTLLPLSLLEAAARGQVETEFSASNLFTLKVPVQGSVIEDGIEISSILLRSSEFEFDDPRLRRSRGLLKQHRRRLSKMVRQYRHWQNRSIAQEAHEQWWKNTQKTSNKTARNSEM